MSDKGHLSGCFFNFSDGMIGLTWLIYLLSGDPRPELKIHMGWGGGGKEERGRVWGGEGKRGKGLEGEGRREERTEGDGRGGNVRDICGSIFHLLPNLNSRWNVPIEGKIRTKTCRPTRYTVLYCVIRDKEEKSPCSHERDIL